MVLVAIGAAKLLHWWDMPQFTVLTALSLRQARAMEENLRADVFPHANHFFSLTVWTSPAAMRRFATSGAHRHALKMGSRLTDTSRFHVYWAEEIPRIPDALAEWHTALPEPLRAQVPRDAA
ncbi:hypothetical protein BXY66_0792 [Shimia isoporae]|uniref:DUF3291 domain-containing protein n=1 Tax=Shimia isoporae TaxID=647720 RepID=A0A4R1NKJ9_9RHOB|nr:hypothetical protein [Shimia isoporae]TCL08754.1 hypothetical protein BXY66_0792 [Shimia isoporae]